MVPCPFRTLWSSLKLMEIYKPQSPGIPLTLTSIYTGTAITPSKPRILWSLHCITRLELYVQTNSYYKDNKITFKMSCQDAISYVGLEWDEDKRQIPNHSCQQHHRHQYFIQHYIQQPKASHGHTIHQRPK